MEKSEKVGGMWNILEKRVSAYKKWNETKALPKTVRTRSPQICHRIKVGR